MKRRTQWHNALRPSLLGDEPSLAKDAAGVNPFLEQVWLRLSRWEFYGASRAMRDGRERLAESQSVELPRYLAVGQVGQVWQVCASPP